MCGKRAEICVEVQAQRREGIAGKGAVVFGQADCGSWEGVRLMIELSIHIDWQEMIALFVGAVIVVALSEMFKASR